MERSEAILLGSKRRFKPIVLTSITTILGLIPLTLQGTNQWSPLCFTIIGGMVSSTILTLIVVPPVYKNISWLSILKFFGLLIMMGGALWLFLEFYNNVFA
jgi:multidrug efflux pump subunit AcrB